MFNTNIYINKILDKLKARLVARGFFQVYRIDYKNVFVPTIKYNILQVFLVIVILENL